MEEEIKLEVAKNVDTKDIELALQTDKKVDEAVVEKSLNYDALTPEEKSAIDEFISKVDVKILHKYYNLVQVHKVISQNSQIVF